jgi:hypothetical protein
MLARYVEQQEAIRTALCILDRNDIVVASDKTQYIEDVIKILEPFEAVTREVSAEKHVSSSVIIPLCKSLQRITASRTDSPAYSLCEKLVEQMNRRFRYMDGNRVIAAATILDPRFKKLPFTDQRAADHIAQHIVAEANRLQENINVNEQLPNSLPPSSNTSSDWQYFDNLVEESTTSRSNAGISAIIEIDQYLTLPLIRRSDDPLLWWKVNGHLFPGLSQAARKYLGGIATSVPSERLFSKAGELISARSRIKDKNVDMILFLNKYRLIS